MPLAGLWPATGDGAVSTTAVVPKAASASSVHTGFLQEVVGFQSSQECWGQPQGPGGGLGHCRHLGGELRESPVQPRSVGPQHPSSPGRAWACPLPAGRGLWAQEGGDLPGAPQPAPPGLGEHVSGVRHGVGGVWWPLCLLRSVCLIQFLKQTVHVRHGCSWTSPVPPAPRNHPGQLGGTLLHTGSDSDKSDLLAAFS